MLGDVLGGIFGFAGSLFAQSAADRRMKKMMAHMREVMAYQRGNIAQAQGSLQGGKQRWEADPRRAKIRSEWEKLLASPSAFTPEFQSSLKQTAVSGIGRDTADTSKRMAASAQRHGIGNSPYAAQMQAGLYRGASQDKANASTAIDVLGEKTRKADYERVFGGYSDWTNDDLISRRCWVRSNTVRRSR
jgi:hypothetical protein